MKISSDKILYVIILLLLFSCHKNSLSEDFLVKAQSIIETDPEKAILFLDSIEQPYKMTKFHYMEYILALTEARFKVGQDVSNDTLVFDALKYFDPNTHVRQAALARYCAGVVCHYRDENKEAMKNMQFARRYACVNDDMLLEGKCLNNIGYEYFLQDMFDSAIVYYKRALDVYEAQEGVDLPKMKVIRSLGVNYYIADSTDQAYDCYMKGLALAEQTNNIKYIIRFQNDLGYVHREMGNYDLSSQYLHAYLKGCETSEDSIYGYLNLMKLYNLQNKLDSSNYCKTQLELRITNSTDIYTLRNIYESVYQYYKIKKDFAKALKYAELENQTSQNIIKQNKAHELMELDKEFQFAQKNEDFEKKKRLNFFLWR